MASMEVIGILVLIILFAGIIILCFLMYPGYFIAGLGIVIAAVIFPVFSRKHKD